MYNVINASNGTGRKAFAGTAYRAAGKTGTAQVFSLNGQSYDAKGLKKNLHDHGWFIGYAPYDNPKIVVSIILENAGGGGSTAAPIARQIMDYALLHQTEATAPLPVEEREPPEAEELSE